MPDQTTPPEQSDDRNHETKGGCQQDACSALQRALDDGQEIKMHRLWNPRDQRYEYHVRIYGDCHVEAERSTLDNAITAAAKLYQEWFDAAD